MRLQTFVHAAVFCYGIKKILWSSDLQITTLQCPQWWEGATAPLSGCGEFLMETQIPVTSSSSAEAPGLLLTASKPCWLPSHLPQKRESC